MSVKSPLERLQALPQIFRFDAAVRLLLHATKSSARREDQITFVASPSLSQPVSEVTEVVLPEADQRPRLTSPMIGLIGASGVMPRWYTELVAQAARAKSQGIVDFFDLLAQRFITAFTAAGAKYRLHRSAEAAQLAGEPEPIGDALLAFTGYAMANLTDRLAAGPDALRHYSGLFAARPRSADRLASMVADYLGRRADIIEFAGAWATLPADQQSRLPRGRFPGAFHELGLNVAIGTRAWDQQARFIVRVGPMSLAEFEPLLPDQQKLRELVSLIRAYVGWECDFAINLVLAVTDIPELRMAAANGPAPRLGWTTWLPSDTGAMTGRLQADEAIFGATLVEELQG